MFRLAKLTGMRGKAGDAIAFYHNWMLCGVIDLVCVRFMREDENYSKFKASCRHNNYVIKTTQCRITRQRRTSGVQCICKHSCAVLHAGCVVFVGKAAGRILCYIVDASLSGD